MRAQESVQFSNISSTPSNFTLEGGAYQLAAVASAWGSVTLNAVGPDGSTLLPITTTAISANGVQDVYCAPGTYQLTVSGVTGLYASLTRIPND